MHRIDLDRAITLLGFGKLEPGRYYAEDQNACHILHETGCWGDCSLEVIDDRPFRSVIPEDFWTERTALLIERVGSFGDMLWLNAIAAEISRQHPGKHLSVACLERYKDVLDPSLVSWVRYPVSERDLRIFTEQGQVLWLENSVEKQLVRGEHPTDFLCREYFGIEPPARKCWYWATDEEQDVAAERLAPLAQKRDGPLVLVQVDSGAGIKDYPAMDRLIYLLWEERFRVVLVGKPRKKGAEQVPPGILDATQQGWSIRECAALACHADVIVGPDSFFFNLGVALDVPVVGLFGPFHGRSYLGTGRGWAFQGRLPCSPCGHHVRDRRTPAGMPCSETGVCAALDRVSPEEVVRKVGDVLENDHVMAPGSAVPNSESTNPDAS